MINQQLVDFIKQQLQVGSTKEKITSQLLVNGWTTQDIEEGFSAIVPPTPTTTPPPISPYSGASYVQNANPIKTAEPQQQTFQPQIKQPSVQQTFTTKKESYSGKKLFLLILILLLLAGGASAYYFKDNLINLPIIKDLFMNKETTISESNIPISNMVDLLDSDRKELEQYLSTYTEKFPLKIVSGIVKKDDTVCKDQNMFVTSMHDPILLKNSLGRPIQADGSFVTLVSKEGHQALLLVNDKKELCLATFSYPNINTAVFDVSSTIIFSTYPAGSNEGFQNLKNYAPFFQFMQKTLKIKTLDEISSDSLKNDLSDEYSNLIKILMEEYDSVTIPKQTCNNYKCLISAASQCQPISVIIPYSEIQLPFDIFQGITMSGQNKYEIKKSSDTKNCTLVFSYPTGSVSLSKKGREYALAQGMTNAEIDIQLKTMNDSDKEASKIETTCSGKKEIITSYLTDEEKNMRGEINTSASIDFNSGQIIYTTSSGQKLTCQQKNI